MIRAVARILEILADLTPEKREKVLAAASAASATIAFVETSAPKAVAVPATAVDPELASVLEALPPQRLDEIVAGEEAALRWRAKLESPLWPGASLGLDEAGDDAPSE